MLARRGQKEQIPHRANKHKLANYNDKRSFSSNHKAKLWKMGVETMRKPPLQTFPQVA